MSTPQKSTVAIQTDEFAILDAIRRYAPEFGLSSTVAESYAIWTICFRRYCLQNGIPWLWMDSVSRFMSYLDDHDDVSPSERNRALDGIMFYLNDVRHVKDQEESEATRRPSDPRSTRSLFAQLLLRCDIGITEALRLRVSNVQLAESRLSIPQHLRAEPKETVELPPSLRRSMKRRVDRVQATAKDSDPLLFESSTSPSREQDVDPEHSTQLATFVMNRLEEKASRAQEEAQVEAESTSGEAEASSTSEPEE